MLAWLVHKPIYIYVGFLYHCVSLCLYHDRVTEGEELRFLEAGYMLQKCSSQNDVYVYSGEIKLQEF